MPQYDLINAVSFGLLRDDKSRRPLHADKQSDLTKNSPGGDGFYPAGYEGLELTEEQAAPLLETGAIKPAGEDVPVGLAHDNPEELGYEGEALRDAPSQEEPAPQGEAPNASPAAINKADELGVNLSEVSGSGQGGKITATDVEKHANQA